MKKLLLVSFELDTNFERWLDVLVTESFLDLMVSLKVSSCILEVAGNTSHIELRIILHISISSSSKYKIN